MSFAQYLTQLIAAIVLRLKRRDFNSGKLKFLVFTGTVGKTTLRDSVTFALRKIGYTVESNRLGYSNELGVLLTALNINKFSIKNPLDWFKVFTAQIKSEKFVCIELGADFYNDIPWFIKRFVPFAVFISGVAEKNWAADIEIITDARKKLLAAVPKDGFVIFNADDEPTKRLMESSDIKAQKVDFSLRNNSALIYVQKWSQNIFSLDIKEALRQEEVLEITVHNHTYKINFQRPLFEPQVYAIAAALGFAAMIIDHQLPQDLFNDYKFAPERLQIHRAKNGATIVEDSYKATPLCTFWLLRAAEKIRAQKKILVITEMRPLALNRKYFYNQLGKLVDFATAVYFLGPLESWQQITEVNKKVERVEIADYAQLANQILKQTDVDSLIVLKGSFRYQLEKLRQLLK